MPTRKDIVFFLSGGPSNRDMNKSFGGPMSGAVIRDFKNNLFDNLERGEIEVGYTDYRCFYLKNQSTTTWSEVRVYTINNLATCPIWIGLQIAKEVQQFNIISNNNVTGGYLTLKVGNIKGIRVDFNADINVWADNFKNALIGAEVFSDLLVDGRIYTQTKTFQIFQIVFQGVDNYRNQELIALDENHLTGDGIEISSVEITKGAPVNTVAVQVSRETDIPPNVVFRQSSFSNPIGVGTLRAGDVVPIWLRRTVEAMSDEIQDVKFGVNVIGKSSLF